MVVMSGARLSGCCQLRGLISYFSELRYSSEPGLTGTFSASHGYARGGVYTATVTVADDDRQRADAEARLDRYQQIGQAVTVALDHLRRTIVSSPLDRRRARNLTFARN